MTINAQALKGAWNEVKGKTLERWGELTDDDLQSARGSVDQLVGLIQRKTGETRAAITSFLNDLTENSSESANTTAETVKEYFSSAAESVRDSTHDAMESVRAGYDQTGKFIRRRPMESLAVCFGAGLIVGVIVAITLRSK